MLRKIHTLPTRKAPLA
jgi:2-oxoglutarate dehydrogenase complex dehydrogenase (E1) component-like enzyme